VRLAGCQRLFGGYALGDVPRDLGVAPQFACLAPQWRRAHMGDEARAILAHARDLRLETPCLAGNLQFLVRLAAAHVLRRVKDREMAAQNLTLFPARYMLS